MKLRHKGEPRPRLRAVDTLAVNETELSPYSGLEALLTPEIREELTKVLGSDELIAERMIAADILNQALQEPVTVTSKTSAEPHVQRPRGLAVLLENHPDLSPMDPVVVTRLATSLVFFPQERDQVVISDSLWQKGMNQLRVKKTSPELRSVKQKVDFLLSLLVLRPDKRKEIQEFVQGDNLLRIAWETKKFLSGGEADLAAHLRIINPDFRLTDEEKKVFVQEFKEASTIDLIHPSIIGWANLAILLAPEVEVDTLGHVKLTKGPGTMHQATPLPPRMAV